MQFNHRLVLDIPVEEAWTLLTEVEGVARCIPGVDFIEPGPRQGTFRVTVRDRVGPFGVTLPLDVEAVDTTPPRLALEARGQEAMTRSHITMRFELALTPLGDGSSQLDVTVDARLTGRLASLGYPVMARLFDEKIRAFSRALAGVAGAGDGRGAQSL